MEENQLDSFSRALAAQTSRRGLLKGAGAVILGAIIGRHPASALAEAGGSPSHGGTEPPLAAATPACNAAQFKSCTEKAGVADAACNLSCTLLRAEPAREKCHAQCQKILAAAVDVCVAQYNCEGNPCFNCVNDVCLNTCGPGTTCVRGEGVPLVCCPNEQACGENCCTAPGTCCFNGQCVQTCPPGTACQNGQCISCAQAGLCESNGRCVAPEHCPACTICRHGQCVSCDQPGANCCPKGAACAPASGQCVCQTTGQPACGTGRSAVCCAEGECCDNGRCVRQCANGGCCVNGVCGCPPGATCQNGQCVCTGSCTTLLNGQCVPCNQVGMCCWFGNSSQGSCVAVCPSGQTCGPTGICQSAQACSGRSVSCPGAPTADSNGCCPDPGEPFVATCNTCPDNANGGKPMCDVACKYTVGFDSQGTFCCDGCNIFGCNNGVTCSEHCPGSTESCSGASCVTYSNGACSCGGCPPVGQC
jgi:hypothetical protein